MSNDNQLTTTIITSLAAILAAAGFPKFWDLLNQWVLNGKGYRKERIENLLDSIKKLKDQRDKQQREIQEQQNQITKLRIELSQLSLKLSILVPFLEKQLAHDPEAMEMLKHLSVNQPKNLTITKP